MKNGTDTLASNSPALNDGASQLKSATDLIISKLTKSEKDADDFVDSFNKVSKAGKEYTSFSGVSDDMSSSVKFVIKIDGIGEEKE